MEQKSLGGLRDGEHLMERKDGRGNGNKLDEMWTDVLWKKRKNIFKAWRKTRGGHIARGGETGEIYGDFMGSELGVKFRGRGGKRTKRRKNGRKFGEIEGWRERGGGGGGGKRLGKEGRREEEEEG